MSKDIRDMEHLQIWNLFESNFELGAWGGGGRRAGGFGQFAVVGLGGSAASAGSWGLGGLGLAA